MAEESVSLELYYRANSIINFTKSKKEQDLTSQNLLLNFSRSTDEEKRKGQNKDFHAWTSLINFPDASNIVTSQTDAVTDDG